MKTVNVLLYYESYLIRLGLRSLLKNLLVDCRIIDTDIESDFIDFAQNEHFDYIFCDKIRANYFSPRRNTKVVILSYDYQKPQGSEYFLDISLNQSIIEEEVSRIIGTQSQVSTNDYNISKRETEIIRLVALGFTNQEIADKLNISLHTVTTHRKNISAKLGIKSISGLTIYAIVNNLIEIKES